MSEERVALVTGAARGLGLGVVGELLAQGWRVCGADIDPDLSDARLAASAGTDPSTVLAVVADVSSDAGCQNVVSQVWQCFRTARCVDQQRWCRRTLDCRSRDRSGRLRARHRRQPRRSVLHEPRRRPSHHRRRSRRSRGEHRVDTRPMRLRQAAVPTPRRRLGCLDWGRRWRSNWHRTTSASTPLHPATCSLPCTRSTWPSSPPPVAGHTKRPSSLFARLFPLVGTAHLRTSDTWSPGCCRQARRM